MSPCELVISIKGGGAKPQFCEDTGNWKVFVIPSGEEKVFAISREFGSGWYPYPVLVISGITILLGKLNRFWPSRIVVTGGHHSKPFHFQGEGVKFVCHAPHLKKAPDPLSQRPSIDGEELDLIESTQVDPNDDEDRVEIGPICSWNGPDHPKNWKDYQGKCLPNKFTDRLEDEITGKRLSFWVTCLQTRIDDYDIDPSKHLPEVTSDALQSEGRAEAREGDILWDYLTVRAWNSLYFQMHCELEPLPDENGPLSLVARLEEVPKNLIRELAFKLLNVYNEFVLVVFELLEDENGQKENGMLLLIVSTVVLIFFNGSRPELPDNESDTWCGERRKLGLPGQKYHGPDITDTMLFFMLPLLLSGTTQVVFIGQDVKEDLSVTIAWVLAQIYLVFGAFSLMCTVEANSGRTRGFMAFQACGPKVAQSRVLAWIFILLAACVPWTINAIAFYVSGPVAFLVMSGLMTLVLIMRYTLDPMSLVHGYRNTTLHLVLDAVITPIRLVAKVISEGRCGAVYDEVRRKFVGKLNTICYGAAAVAAVGIAIGVLQTDMFPQPGPDDV